MTRESIKSQADIVMDAKTALEKYQGLPGKIISARLKYNGFVTFVNEEGRKVFVEAA